MLPFFALYLYFYSRLFGGLLALSAEDMQALFSIDIRSWKDLSERILCKIFAGMDPSYAGIAKSENQRNENEKTVYDAFMTIWDDDYNETGKYANLREAIEHHADEHKEVPYAEIIPAIAIIAKGMHSILRNTQWENMTQLEAESLSEKIQGMQLLSGETVIDQLKWTGPYTETSEQTKTFLKEWLRQANPDDLKRFVKAVTGSTSLTKQSELKMRLYTADPPEKLPVSHTCFNTLDLPTTYTNQEILNDKMQKYLEHALAGTGFTIG